MTHEAASQSKLHQIERKYLTKKIEKKIQTITSFISCDKVSKIIC